MGLLNRSHEIVLSTPILRESKLAPEIWQNAMLAACVVLAENYHLMTDAFSALPFSHHDLQLLAVDEVSVHLQTSRAFVRLFLAAGCPTRAGRLSAAELLHWLFEHYAEVRQKAGFAMLRPITALHEPTRRRCKMAHAVITLSEFNVSRSSSLYEKRHFYGVIQTVQRAIGGM